MAFVYKRPLGSPHTIERFVAGMPGVQGRMHIHAQEIAAVARRDLAGHKETGNAKIVVTHGDIDYYVGLDDAGNAAGLKHMAAMSIEYGRGPNRAGRGSMVGLSILHKAAGLPLKASYPRSKRTKEYYNKKRRK